MHFATHGFLPVESSVGEPALILSYDGQDEDRMMFKMSDILGLNLHSEMVVLSACNTGVRKGHTRRRCRKPRHRLLGSRSLKRHGEPLGSRG